MRLLLVCVSLCVLGCTPPPKEMDAGTANPLPHLTLEGATAACAAPTVTGRSDGSCLSNSACNPFRRDACAAGEVCDWRGEGFACQPAVSVTASDCEACDVAAGRFCAPGLTCLGSQCVRSCCDDTDCGANAKCQKSANDQSATGACVAKPLDACGTAAEKVFDAGACASCMATYCCDWASDCAREDDCRACAAGSAVACALSDRDERMFSCRADHCSDVCAAPPGAPVASCAPRSTPPVGLCAVVDIGAGRTCNPVTNERCADGVEACVPGVGGALCNVRPLAAEACGACNEAFGQLCAGGLGCFQGQCAPYCCDDTDCGAGARCVVPAGTLLGHCLE